MKKIMFIHHSGGIGGAGVSLYNTVLTLSKKFEVIVYCPSEPDLYYSFLKENNINVKTYSFPLGSIPYYSGGTNLFSPSFIRSIINIKLQQKKWEDILRFEKPDLLIVNSRILSWFSVLTTKLNLKSICFIRETRKKTVFNIISNIQKAFLEKFSAVVFISNYDMVLENLQIAKSRVIPNFVASRFFLQNKENVELYTNYGIARSSFKILFVGGMLRIKGYDVAVKALKYLKKYDVCLIVAGDPVFRYKNEKGVANKAYNFFKKRYEVNINNEIMNNSLSSMIIKVGIQSDMKDLYKIADVLIFPANVPHQARPAFEAGAQKKPVIMPDFINTEEYVKDGINGLIFEHHNPKSLAERILTLIKNNDLKNKLGEENFRQTIKNHTKEFSEKLLMEIVNEVVHKDNSLE